MDVPSDQPFCLSAADRRFPRFTPAIAHDRARIAHGRGCDLLAAATGDSYTGEVSTVEQPDEPAVRFYPAEEALDRARPLPSPDELEIEGLTDEEWVAFQEALAEL